jgi:hypothetical protein
MYSVKEKLDKGASAIDKVMELSWLFNLPACLQKAPFVRQNALKHLLLQQAEKLCHHLVTYGNRVYTNYYHEQKKWNYKKIGFQTALVQLLLFCQASFPKNMADGNHRCHPTTSQNYKLPHQKVWLVMGLVLALEAG